MIRKWFTPVALVLLLLGSSESPAAEGKEEFNLGGAIQRRGNIFDLFFGPAPPMATQRGILIIRAFHDRNDNGVLDSDEELLRDRVSCLVDEVSYTVPAFIPGLQLNGNFPVQCEGEQYFPKRARDVFVGHKGQIIRLDLACIPATGTPPDSPRPGEPSVNGDGDARE